MKQRFRTWLRASVLPLGVAFGGALVTACSGGTGSEVEGPGTSQELLCQNEGIHIEGFCVPKPTLTAPDFPTPVACAAGTTCAFTPTSLPAPNAACSAPEWFSETGGASAGYLVAACATILGGQSLINSWIATHPGYGAAQSSVLPGLPTAGSGTTYLHFVTPMPGNGCKPGATGPSACALPNGKAWVDPSNQRLPCTGIYAFPSDKTNAGATGYASFLVAYCVAGPAVDAWASGVAGSTSVSTGGGESAAPNGLPPAAPGYIYLDLWSRVDDIGNGCSRGCASN